MRNAPQRLSYAETRALDDFLRTVCSKVNGFAVYAGGWDDRKVAEEVSRHLGREVSENSVKNLRREFFGNFDRAPQNDSARIAALEEKVRALETDNERIFNDKNRLAGQIEALTKRLDVMERRLPVFDPNDARMVPRSVAHAAA